MKIIVRFHPVRMSHLHVNVGVTQSVSLCVCVTALRREREALPRTGVLAKNLVFLQINTRWHGELDK